MLFRSVHRRRLAVSAGGVATLFCGVYDSDSTHSYCFASVFVSFVFLWTCACMKLCVSLFVSKFVWSLSRWKWSKLAFPLCNVVADHDVLGVFDNDGGSFYEDDCGDEVNGVIASNPVVLLDFCLWFFLRSRRGVILVFGLVLPES